MFLALDSWAYWDSDSQ